MPLTVIVHIQNGEPVLGELDDVPGAADQLITIRNARKMDGNELHYLNESATSVIFPVIRINFIEVLSGGDEEEIFGFVRE